MTYETDILPSPALDVFVPPEGEWEKNERAFFGMLPQLMQSHLNQYVAVHNNQIVATGSNLVDTAMEAYKRCGYVPVYVNLVSDKPPEVVRIPSPRVDPEFFNRSS